METLLSGQLKNGGVFLVGGRKELVRLFGMPLPKLPPGQAVPGQGERIFVESKPELRENFRRHLQYLTHTVGQEGGFPGGGDGIVTDQVEKDYAELLFEILRHVVISDRRQGLLNLFWLMHSREIAETIDVYFSNSPKLSHLRYQIHPLLSGLFHRLEERVFSSFNRPQEKMVRFQLGSSYNASLIHSIMDDQLPLTENDPNLFDPHRILIPENRRFRLSAEAFEEIHDILRTQLEKGVESGDQNLRKLLKEVSPGDMPGTGGDSSRLDRYLYQEPVRQYLLHDFDEVGRLMTRSKILKKEKRRYGTWGEFLQLYFDVVTCLRRMEAISYLRRGLSLTAKGLDDQETREKFLEGRLYRFSRRTRIVSGIRTVTVLFADLRDFTRVSEGAISEKDLTAEIYSIFDPATVIISRFGGHLDKFLGDGFMATFGAYRRSGEEALSAVRAAVAIQQILGRLRKMKRTDFEMGVSLHTGRVSIAQFLRGPDLEETTVIGRQVNIAGRLSSSKGAQLDISVEEHRQRQDAVKAAGAESRTRSAGGVTIDPDGNLLNTGIAVSRNLLDELQKTAKLEGYRQGDESGFAFFDGKLNLWLKFKYLGEARFKGLEGSVSIFSLITTPLGN